MRIKNQLALTLLTALLCYFTTSCNCEQQSITGTNWQVVSLYGTPITGADTDSYTLLFDDEGNLSGKGECNRLMGRYTTEKGRNITIEPVGSTMMFCPNIETEDRLKSALESVTSYVISNDGVLTLYSGKEMVAQLSNQ